MAERVRNALMELEEIPEGEQQQVIADFMGRSAGDDDSGVEFDPSLTGGLEERNAARLKPTSRRFIFAGREPAMLAAYLRRSIPRPRRGDFALAAGTSGSRPRTNAGGAQHRSAATDGLAG